MMTNLSTDKPSILIIDDDDQIRTLLTQLLIARNDCTAVESAEKAVAILDSSEFDLVLSDINMAGISGLELVPIVLQKNPDSVVMMISGEHAIDRAIEAMRVGAFDYITKPIDIDHLEAAVRRALSHHKLLREKRQYENHLEEMVKERTARIEHLAYYDRLTELPNRALFMERCEQALQTAHVDEQVTSVALVSLDRFKNINDTLGHSSGDQLLKAAAVRIQGAVGTEHTVARFEGPEFAILLNGNQSARAIEDVCLSILEAFKTSFLVGHQEVYLTTSIGIWSGSTDDAAASKVLQNAGAALYRAKKAGGNNYKFHTTDMNATALNRLALETSLRHAIDNEEFLTFYQPVVNLSSMETVGLEALVRWRHPQLGVLPPSKFLDLAENTGLILDISECVMRSACKQTRQWQKEGLANLRIAVNISARQFQQKHFIDRIIEMLTETHLEPRFLELELTESSIMENPESAAEILTEIRRLGARVAIDDFGTGYSSLSYLKRFCVDTLKLDRLFVQGAIHNPSDAALVRAMTTLAHDLNLRVVAEGIETESELAFVKNLKCDEGQGFLFSKPQPADVLQQTLLESLTTH